MPVVRNVTQPDKFNPAAELPFELRVDDLRAAMQHVYDFFYDVNVGLTAKGLERLDDMLRPASLSGVVSDMLTARRSRLLTGDRWHSLSCILARFP